MQTYNTALVIIPPEEIWEPIQEIRREYDRKIRRWMPHITLLYPFLPVEQFSQVNEFLSQLVGTFRHMEVSLTDVRYFRLGNENYKLWLSVQPYRDVKIFYRTLVDAMEKEYMEDYEKDFVPHLSIGQARGPKKLSHICEKVRGIWKPVQFTITQVSLVSRDDPPNDIFHVDKQILLGTLY